MAHTLPAHWPPGQLCVCGAGQAGELPVQLAGKVAVPDVQLPARHCVLDARKASVGQLSLLPVHVSSTSHTAVSARHTNVLGRFRSAGHVGELPLQASGLSQGPAADRHTLPAFPGGCWQELLVPSQRSAVQAFPSSVQPLPLCFL